MAKLTAWQMIDRAAKCAIVSNGDIPIKAFYDHVAPATRYAESQGNAYVDYFDERGDHIGAANYDTVDNATEWTYYYTER